MKTSFLVIKKFIQLSWASDKKVMVKYLFSLVALSIYTIISPILNGLIIDSMTKKHFSLASIVTFVFIVLYPVTVSLIIGYQKELLSDRLSNDFQVKALLNLLSNEENINIEYSKGDVLSNITMHISTVVNLGVLIISFLSNVIMAFFSAIGLLVANPLVFLVGCIFVPIILWVNWLCNRGLTDIASNNSKMQAESTNAINNVILAYEEIKFIKDKSTFRNSFQDIQNWFTKNGLLNDMKINSPGYVLDIITGLIGVLGYILGYLFVKGDNNKLAHIVVITSYLGNFIGKIAFISLIKSLSYPLQYSINQIENSIITPITQNSGTNDYGEDVDNIEAFAIDNISFGYDNNSNVISGLSYRFPKSGIVVLSGGSGSGKTTLIKLLIGSYSPKYGKISVNQIDLQNLSKNKFMKRVGYVQQHGMLFAGTFLENLNIFSSEYRKEYVDYLIDLLNLKSELQDDIYNFEIKEGSKNISVGQRDRVKLICVLAKEPDIIILDEPTAALDAYNSEKILNLLEKISHTSLIIIATHDTSFCKIAKDIVYLGE